MKKVQFLMFLVALVSMFLSSCEKLSPTMVGDPNMGEISFSFQQSERGWPSGPEWQLLMSYMVVKSDSLFVRLGEVPSCGDSRWDTTCILPVENGVVKGKIYLRAGAYTMKEAYLFTRRYPHPGYYYESFYTPEEKDIYITGGTQTLNIFLTNNKVIPANVSVHNYLGDTKTPNKLYDLWIVSDSAWISNADTITFPKGLKKWKGICREKNISNCKKDTTFDFVAEFKEEAFKSLFHFKIWDACHHHEFPNFWIGQNITVNDTVDLYYNMSDLQINLLFDHKVKPVVECISPTNGSTATAVQVIRASFNKPVDQFILSSFTVTGPNGAISATNILQVGRNISFNLASPLPAGAYVVILTGTDKYLQAWDNFTWAFNAQ